MSLVNLQKRLTNLLDEEDIDLRGTKVEAVLPTSMKSIFSRRKRRLIGIFKEIERRVKKKADPIYEDMERFREIGGYFLIRGKESRYLLESVFETEGEIGRQVVIPGRGLDFRWDCTFPEINELNIDWEPVISFIRYHSHPFTNHPHPQDITAGIRNLRDIPKNAEYLQTIYSKIWIPSFLWLKHY